MKELANTSSRIKVQGSSKLRSWKRSKDDISKKKNRQAKDVADRQTNILAPIKKNTVRKKRFKEIYPIIKTKEEKIRK